MANDSNELRTMLALTIVSYIKAEPFDIQLILVGLHSLILIASISSINEKVYGLGGT